MTFVCQATRMRHCVGCLNASHSPQGQAGASPAAFKWTINRVGISRCRLWCLNAVIQRYVQCRRVIVTCWVGCWAIPCTLIYHSVAVIWSLKKCIWYWWELRRLCIFYPGHFLRCLDSWFCSRSVCIQSLSGCDYQIFYLLLIVSPISLPLGVVQSIVMYRLTLPLAFRKLCGQISPNYLCCLWLVPSLVALYVTWPTSTFVN